MTNQEKLTDLNKTISTKKAIVTWEIPIAGDVRQISRDYFVGSDISAYNTQTIATVGLPFRNSIRDKINWCTALNKKTSTFTQAERDYIVEYGKPYEWQVEDEFKLCAWVEVTDVTGLNKGDTVTGVTTGATGTIERIDQILHTNRIVIKGATASFEGDTTLTANATSLHYFRIKRV